MCPPLQSLIEGIVSLLPLRLFTNLYNSDQDLPSSCKTELKNVSCASLFAVNSFFLESLLSSCWKWSPIFLLLYALLTFTLSRPTSLLYYSESAFGFTFTRNKTFDTLKNNVLEIFRYTLYATTFTHVGNLSPKKILKSQQVCFMVHEYTSFLLSLTAMSAPFHI